MTSITSFGVSASIYAKYITMLALQKYQDQFKHHSHTTTCSYLFKTWYI